MSKPGRIQATRVADLEEITRSRHVITLTVGPHHDLVVLSLDGPPDYRKTAPSGCSFAKLRADRPNRYRIDHFQGSQWQSIALVPTKENFHNVQPLGEDWLLIRGRAKGERDRNAHVYGADGAPGRSFHVGDAVADVQASVKGDCWVSFFDEAPLEQGGLACFDRHGRRVFRFSDLDPPAPFILDCYALNVCDEGEVWACYYTDFPVVRLVDRKVARIWLKVGVTGSYAFAVAGHRVLFAGTYKHDNSLFLADLEKSRVQEQVPVTEAGRMIRSFTAFGRGSRLYLHSGTEVFAVDLAEDRGKTP